MARSAFQRSGFLGWVAVFLAVSGCQDAALAGGDGLQVYDVQEDLLDPEVDAPSGVDSVGSDAMGQTDAAGADESQTDADVPQGDGGDSADDATAAEDSLTDGEFADQDSAVEADAPGPADVADAFASGDSGAADAGDGAAPPGDAALGDQGTASDTDTASGDAPDLTGLPCSDGNACTVGDEWQGGECLGQWKGCDDGKACTQDNCEASTGQCSHVVQSGGCDDGDPCTQGEACQGAKGCGGGLPISCDDGLPCTADSCSPDSGCLHVATNVGGACGTGSVCLASGACVNSFKCEGMPALCDDGESCTVDFCDPQLGCLHLDQPDKSSCDDGDTCTPFATDRCESGVCTNKTNVCACKQDSDCAQFDDGDLCNGVFACIAGPSGAKLCQPKPKSAIQCPALAASSCHTASCDPASGKCLAKPLGDGSWCDDAEPCTQKSFCSKGICQGKLAMGCDDGNPCTVDSCVPGSGCVSIAVSGPGCMACDQCDDKNPCTIDTCDSSGCGHAPQKCNSGGDPCVTASCVATGADSWTCALTPKPSVAPLQPAVPCNLFDSLDICPEGYKCNAPADKPEIATCQPKLSTACSDGDACTSGDTCEGGLCKPGAPSGCDDDDPCTSDACGSGGCLHTAIAGCKVCIQEAFQTEAWQAQWAAHDDFDAYVNWEVAPEPNGNQRQVATWKGPFTKAKVNQGAYLDARRLHLAPGVPAQIDFWYRTSLGTPNCGSDDLELWGNGRLLWRECASTPGGSQGAYQHAKVDLAALVGSPIELQFRILAGPEPAAYGKVELDKVRLAGGCSEACMGGHMESLSTARDVPSSPIPQGWKLTSSDPDYVAWGRTYTGGRQGLGAMTARWTGQPTTGKPQTALFRVPMVRPADGSKLHFAVRAVFAADASCDADALTVRVAGTQVFQQCSAQSQWKAQAVDLSPWAGQDVDVTFEVKTGAGPDTLGLFQIDDITLTGACSYACFLSTFNEPGATDGWWKGNTPGAASWTHSPSEASGGSGSLKAQLPANLAKGAMTTIMPTDKWRWAMPVNGASFELKAKLGAELATCPFEQFRTRIVYEYRGIAPTEPKEVLTSPFMYDIADQCDTGEDAFKIELGDPIRGRKFLPLFILQKADNLPGGQGANSVELDDFLIRCR